MKYYAILVGAVLMSCHPPQPVCPPCHCPDVSKQVPPDTQTNKTLLIAGKPDTSAKPTPKVIPLEPPNQEPPELLSVPAPVESAVFPAECRVIGKTPPPSPRHKKWRELAKIRVGQSHLSTVDVSVDETLLLVMSSNEGSVRIYDIETRRLLGNYAMYPSGSFERGEAAFWRGPGDKPRFIFANEDGISLYDALSGEKLRQLSKSPCWGVRWSDDNSLLVANLPKIPAQTSQLIFYEVDGPDSLKEIRNYSFEQRIDGWDLACGNRLLAATFYPGDDIRLFDLAGTEQPKPIWKVPAPKFSAYVDISPRGDMVAVGGNMLLLLDIEKPDESAVFTKYNNNLNTVRFHPDGGVVATSSYDGQVQIIESVLTGKTLRRLKLLKHQGTANVYGIVFYKNGTRMVTSSGDRTVRIWGIRGD